MKAIVLAGGFAKRMWPLTKTIAKPLLKIAGKPVIDFLMEKLMEIKELSEVIVSINRRFEDQFAKWLKSKNYENVRLVVEESMREEEKPGATAAIARITPLLNGEDCLITAGDNLFTFSLKGFLKYYFKKKSPVIGLYDVKDLNLAKKYAVVELDNNSKIINLIEKPKNPKSSLVATCIYAMPYKTLNLIHKYLEEGGNRDAPGYFIEWLYKRVNIYGYVFKGLWFDIGDINVYMNVKQQFEQMTNVSEFKEKSV